MTAPTPEQRARTQSDIDWHARNHHLIVATSLEAAVRYMIATDALTLAQMRQRLADAIDAAHATADKFFPLPVADEVVTSEVAE
jgi:hypothetical protein